MSGLLALIPARRGSQRVPNKNVRELAGHPLIAYTIAVARASGLFERVIVSTDAEEIAAMARRYGAETPFLRPPELATATAPDIGWVLHALEQIAEQGGRPSAFALLRPTSPFRSVDTLKRAWSEMSVDAGAESLRAVEPCEQHPAKMWTIGGDRLVPVMPGTLADGTPWHSTPYQALPQIYAQNASLELARVPAVLATRTISGRRIRPFFTQGFEGYDINDERDWRYAEILVAERRAQLPTVPVAASSALDRATR